MIFILTTEAPSPPSHLDHLGTISSSHSRWAVTLRAALKFNPPQQERNNRIRWHLPRGKIMNKTFSWIPSSHQCEKKMSRDLLIDLKHYLLSNYYLHGPTPGTEWAAREQRPRQWKSTSLPISRLHGKPTLERSVNPLRKGRAWATEPSNMLGFEMFQ